MKNFLILGAIASLTACGTTTNPPPTTTPTPLSAVSKDMTAAITGIVTAGDVNGTATAISIAGVPLVNLLRQSALNSTNGTFAAAVADNAGNPFEIAFSGVTASGGMTATMAGEYFGTNGVTYARTGQTTLPTSGTGSFSGDYVGYFGDPIGGFHVAVLGDASLTVTDWSSPTISGTISNRKAYKGDGSPGVFTNFLDIDLASTAIGTDGTYSGTATGGEAVGGPTLTSAGVGTYEGLIGGTSGTETAGGIKIDSAYNSVNFSETGAFLAN